MTAFDYASTSRFLDTPKGRIHYHEAGAQEDNGAPVLLMIHGSGPGVNGWANFQGNLPVFAQHFRCLIIDLPGYGESDAVDGVPVPVCVEAVMHLLDGLGIAQCHILGNSLGGIVGSFVAAYHPQRVQRFVTIGGIGMNVFSTFPGQGLGLLVDFAEDPTREKIEAWLRSMVFDQSIVTDALIDARFNSATDPKVLATSRKLYSRAAAEALAKEFRGPNATQRVAHLASITAPTLITWGRDDRVSPLDMALLPMRVIPNAELHVFPNCGHWGMIECKQAFESLVLSFLKRP